MESQISRSSTRKLTACALLLFQIGCWDFYAVRSFLVVSEHEQQPPEITETDAYRTIKGNVDRIAVIAPDRCTNETSSQIKGEMAANSSVLLKSNCGQEMAILERTLAESGYRIVSWTVVSSRSESEGKAPLDIARSMGADILLQINSMERLTLENNLDLKWERRFFLADSQWHIGAPVDVDPYTRDQIVEHARSVEDQFRRGHPAVSLNVTVISVETGEAVWFYERTLSSDYDINGYESVSYSACSLKNRLCKPWPKRRQRRTDSAPSFGVVELESRGRTTRERAVYYELLQQLIQEMVKNFEVGISPAQPKT